MNQNTRNARCRTKNCVKMKTNDSYCLTHRFNVPLTSTKLNSSNMSVKRSVIAQKKTERGAIEGETEDPVGLLLDYRKKYIQDW